MFQEYCQTHSFEGKKNQILSVPPSYSKSENLTFIVGLGENKNEFLEVLSKDLDCTKTKANVVLSSVFRCIEQSLKNSNEFRFKVNNCTDKKVIEKYINDFF